jgi:hypothetical protein
MGSMGSKYSTREKMRSITDIEFWSETLERIFQIEDLSSYNMERIL